MGLVLFVAELGSGFGHVRRLLPLARAALDAGYRAHFLVPNVAEVAPLFATVPGLTVDVAPIAGAPASGVERGAVATSFADILGGAGFAHAEFLLRATRAWDEKLTTLDPVAVVSELSPFLNLACFGGSLPVLVVGHGFIVPPPHLPAFPRLWNAAPLFEEAQLLSRVQSVCRVRRRDAPAALPALFAGTAHAVTGLDLLDPYRHERRAPASGPPDLEIGDGSRAPDEDVFVYLLGEAEITSPILRRLAANGTSGRVFVRRANAEQHALVASSRLTWLDRPAPMHEALTRARLVVHHGSMLTSEEALLTGRAQLVVPLYLEHLLTARTLKELGVAEIARPRDEPAQLDRQLIAALSAPSAETARAVAAGYTGFVSRSAELAPQLLSLVTGVAGAARSTSRSGSVAVGVEPTEAIAPVVSFVVPSYQMAPYLRLTLQSFRQLERDARVPFEVVVVDDGSSDGTQAELAHAAPLLEGLRWVFRPRDELSCRSLARNLGARESRGRYLLFIDAGVMIHPLLLAALAQHWSRPGGEQDVIVLETLGLFLSQADGSPSATLHHFAKLNAESFGATLSKLRGEPPWADPRKAWFDLTHGDLSQLPAPWLLAWSSALVLPRTVFERCTGFDESFVSWGAEDCDFALALFSVGARFRALAAPSALHVPHPTQSAEIKKRLHRANALRMHAKRATREGELFVTLEDPFAANLWALRLDRTPIERLLPYWTAASLSALAALLPDRERSRALFIAAPTPALAVHFSNVDWVVPSAPLAATVARARSTAVCAVGCHTSEKAQSRAIVVLTDVIRLLPAVVQGAQLVEAVRVGERAYLVCLTPGPAPTEEFELQQALHGWPLSAIDSLRSVAEQVGIRLTELPSSHSALRAFSLTRALFEIVPSGSSPE